jgi:hypothetical protein
MTPATDPLVEIAAAWEPFAGGLEWARWCEEDRAAEAAEQFEDLRAEMLAAARFESKHEVDRELVLEELAA